jgi:hypothetical protein
MRRDTVIRADEDLRISVTTDWKDWRSTRVRVADLLDVHWHQPLGAPHPLVHAYIACSEIVGDRPHICDATSTPHRVRVCVLKSHNIPSVYTALARRADQPSSPLARAAVTPVENRTSTAARGI